jgi:putative ABC transport system substrate-binding protein
MSTFIQRRECITLLGGAAAAWPVAARAQQPAMPVIGFLGSEPPDPWANRVRAFRQGLSEIGYVEGRNVAIEYRWAEGQYDRLPALAADLVRRQVTLIATVVNSPAALAAKAATTTIPIVFAVGIDPVQFGLVASLNRPGGNLTGVTTLAGDLGPKRLELLHELVPTATLLALLVNPTSPIGAETQLRDLQAAARTLGLQLHVLHASTERDLDAVFATLVQLRAGGLVISSDGFLGSRNEQLAALAFRHAVPVIASNRDFAAAGGLMNYGGSVADAFRLVGVYSGRILKGDKPSDLPVQQATRVELIINMKTAKALGLTFPITLLGRADEVIE